MSELARFDQPLYNAFTETIPGSAIVEVKTPGFVPIAGRDYFNVTKPTAEGRIYFINSPFPIEPGKTGKGATGFRSPGVHALFDATEFPSGNGFEVTGGPKAGDQIGPTAGKWELTKAGSGYFVIGDVLGSPASQPGFPPSASTKRVRVVCLGAASEPANADPVTIQITSNIPAATWTGGKLQPIYFSARLMVAEENSDGSFTGRLMPEVRDQGQDDTPRFVRCVSTMIDAVEVASGKFRIGKGIRIVGVSPWNQPPFYDEDAFDPDDPTTFPPSVDLFNVSCTERAL